MAKNTVPIIIGAVLFGVLALGLTFYTLLNGGAPAPPPEARSGNAAAAQSGPSSTFYKARRVIYPRTVITRDMLEESEGDASKFPGAITDENAVLGRLANRTIQAGQVMTAQNVITGVGRVIPANIAIPAGLRGVAIWVDPDQTAAGLVDVGDRVDVIVAHDIVDGKTTANASSVDFTAGRTIAQNLEVLAVDKSIQEYRPPAANPNNAPGANGQAAPDANAAPAPGQPGPQPEGQQPVKAPGAESRMRVILAATPAIAQLLVTNDKQSELFLTIRNPNSREQFVLAENREYNKTSIKEAAATKAPAPTPAASGGTSRSNRDRGSYEPTMGPMFPAPAPVPPAPIVTGEKFTTPPPAPEKDVTVVRGTEKTRVIVPR